MSQIKIFKTVSCLVQFKSSSNSDVTESLDNENIDNTDDLTANDGPLTLYLTFLSSSDRISLLRFLFCCSVSLLKEKS